MTLLTEQEQQAAEQVVASPKVHPRRRAVDLIVAETGCSRNRAKKTIRWMNGFIERARRAEYDTQYPTAGQLASPNYDVFDAVIPHGEPSTPGSAHEAIELALLDPSKDEFSLRHDMDSREYCAVDVLVGHMG